MKYFIVAILLISIILNFYFVPKFLKLNVSMEKLSFQIVDYSKEIKVKMGDLNAMIEDRDKRLSECMDDKKRLINKFAIIVNDLKECESHGINIQKCIDIMKE